VLRALELPTRRTKLCLISGATLLVRAAERLGADAYVQKPFELETLLGHVARLMGDEPRGRLPPVA
jgi:CheY-like chemotaxis protein